MILVSKPTKTTRPPWERSPAEAATVWHPFEITDWPRAIGHKVDKLEIEGYIVYGAFATAKKDKVFTITYDYFEILKPEIVFSPDSLRDSW
jgi:hypothetical protein